jgi:hypothetical protein
MTIWVTQIDDELLKIYNLINNLIEGNRELILLGEQCISLYTIKEKGRRSHLCSRILSITIIKNSKGVKKYKISLNVSGPRRSCIIGLDEEKIDKYLQETVFPLIERYSS